MQFCSPSLFYKALLDSPKNKRLFFIVISFHAWNFFLLKTLCASFKKMQIKWKNLWRFVYKCFNLLLYLAALTASLTAEWTECINLIISQISKHFVCMLMLLAFVWLRLSSLSLPRIAWQWLLECLLGILLKLHLYYSYFTCLTFCCGLIAKDKSLAVLFSTISPVASKVRWKM